jgi:hypothetical protein
MKRGLLIGIIAIVAILVLGFGGYYYFKIATQGSLTCSQAGYTSSFVSAKGEVVNYNCCEGLGSISADMKYEPSNEDADENGCLWGEGAGMICSDCGNGVCENWENPCNCLADCPK